MIAAAPERVAGLDLHGRASDLEAIERFLSEARVRGGGLLLVGEPGVGKSVLLAAAAEAAAAAGTRVLRVGGIEFEADLGFGALNQIALPLRERVDGLPADHRRALSVALGLAGGDASPQRLALATATHALLSEEAAAQPVLVVVDDVQWLDRASAMVLGSVARRLDGTRVGLLAAARSATESFFEHAGLPVHEVRPLGDEAALALLRARFGDLAPRVRRRVVAEARGNPLALLELPSGLTAPQRAAAEQLPPFLPLTRRLHGLFAARLHALDDRTRELLLLAALEASGQPQVLEAAGVGEGDLAAAEAAGLVSVDAGGHVRFRHPLARAAVVESAAREVIRRAHRALAGAVEDADRRAWHLADACDGRDGDVAQRLEDVGHRVLRRGDGAGAVAALIRAAELSPSRPDRARRLAHAAYVGANVTGELAAVSRLVGAVRRADPELARSLPVAVAAAHVLLNDEGDVETAHRLLVGALEGTAAGDAPELETDALHTLALVCHFGHRPQLWGAFHIEMRRLGDRAPGSLPLCARTLSDPVRLAIPVLGRIDAAIAGLDGEDDPAEIVRVAIAGFWVDRLGGCRPALRRVVESGRAGEAVASAINAHFLLCIDAFRAGRWDEARTHAEEGLQHCEANGYRMLAVPGRYALALLAATRGDDATAARLCEEICGWGLPRGAAIVEQYASHVRTLAALGRGDVEEAYRQACAITPPGELADHSVLAPWTAMDLVEAAVHTGRLREARAHVAALERHRVGELSPRLALLVAGAKAMAADDDEAPALYEQALATPGTEHCLFERARIRFAYGERLRRTRATAQSRAPLAAAQDAFASLGARAWEARAAAEMRATGRTRGRGDADGDALTPQELEIASLAAAGLSNKQIGERLFLSHRTVGAHLYRVYPKLGIASRAALRDALADQSPQ
jgi:DNA-binding CsgD family transcriptional regulator